MATAVGDPDFRPGMVSVIQAHGDLLGWHPHVHAITSRGGWDTEGRFIPVPFVGTAEAERLFRHRVITLLRDEDLLSQERIELLLSWKHSGFSAHNAVTVPPGDDDGIERLGRYLLRSPVALERMRFDQGMGCVRYRRKSLRGPGPFEKTFEASEFLARLLQHVPEPRLHQIRYYGHYSNVARARRTAESPSVALPGPGESETTEPGAAERRRLRPGSAPRPWRGRGSG